MRHKLLEDKVAIVTGGGRGIGQAIAQRLAQEGSAVMIAEIEAGAGEAARDALNAQGLRAAFMPTDITREAHVQDMVAQCAREFGGVDILVNNAGRNFFLDATQMTEADWDAAMNVDLKGAWLCCKHAIPRMVERGGGAIVNIASIHARLTLGGMFPYAAAKAGLVGLTRSLALDWGRHNIRVNAVSPGWVRTYLVDEWLSLQADPIAAEARVLAAHPMGRIGTPQEVASFVAYLASDEASFITGAELAIDGGLGSRFAT